MNSRHSIPILGVLFDRQTMLPAWAGALVLSFAWLHALWIYAPAAQGVAWFATGVVLMLVGCRDGVIGPRRLPRFESVCLGAASAVGVAFLPRPYDLGPALLLASALLSLLPCPALLRRMLIPGLWVAGLVLTLQAALVPVLFIVAARLHDAPFLAPLVYYPLKLVAPATVQSGATLQMLTSVDWIPLTPSWEKLALVPGALIAAAFTTLVLLRRDGVRHLPALVLLGLLYAWLRLVILFLVVSQFRRQQLFWDLSALCVSFVPWVFIVAVWHRMATARDSSNDAGAATEPEDAAPAAGGRRVALAAVLCVAGFTFFWGYQDPGRAKPGRILIDEGHSDWEWTTEAFDKAWYGGKSGYNYYCLAEYWSHFYTVETRREPLTPALLAAWDVLVIKTPTSAYGRAEVDAIADFVKRGGGLFLVGDHTNVFGSGTYLNAIAERFGLYFRYDATYRLDNLDLSLWQPPALLPHAVVRNMGEFLFATSCSLDSPLLSENVLLGYGLRSIYLDYAETSYFPAKKGDKTDDMYPLFVQSGGVRFGRGRVLGFTDSTVFSNFFMFVPGKPELALGSIEWLNRINGHGWALRLSLGLGIAGLLLLLWQLARAPRVRYFDGLVSAGLLTFVVVAAWCERGAARDYALPRPVRSIQDVTFDGEHGFFGLPTRSLLPDHWSNIQTFYVWMQRLGLVPRVAPNLHEYLRSPGRVLVEHNSNRAYTLAEVDGIVDFVRRGGILLVLDTPLNGESQSNTVLGPFSMSFVPERRDSLAVLRPPAPVGDWLSGPVPGDSLGIAVKAFALTGSKPLLTLSDGAVVMGERDFGAGKVIAFGASQLFSTPAMGSTAMIPTPRMRALFQVQYDLFENVAGIRVTSRYTGKSVP